MEQITAALTQLGTLAGFAALVSVIINVLKVVGVVKDGTAPIWAVGANLIGLITLIVIGFVKPDMDLTGIDAQFGQLAQILLMSLSFVVQVASSKFTHAMLKNVPLIGKSFSS